MWVGQGPLGVFAGSALVGALWKFANIKQVKVAIKGNKVISIKTK